MVEPTPLARVATALKDSFANFVTRIGYAGDKNVANTYIFAPATQAEIEAAYRSSIFRKIIDIVPGDMTRQWREWQADDKVIEAIEAEEKRLDLPRKIRWAMILGRLYGGAIAYMGGKGMGDPATPLDRTKVAKGALEYIHVLHRWQVRADEIDLDPLSEGFGGPKMYVVTTTNGVDVRIHPSRVIKFIGERVPQGMTGITDTEQGWGDSLWEVIKEAVMHADDSAANISALIKEAKVDVMRIAGFMTGMATDGYEARLIRRFAVMAEAKSNLSMTLLDKEDEWDRKVTNFAGLDDIAKLFLMIMCAVADIPATRLLGKSPDGMNSTGESDLRNYYDRLKDEQESDLRPTLTPLDEVLQMSALGKIDPGVTYKWGPLWQLTSVEKATRDKTVADTIKVYGDLAVFPDTVMAKIAQNRVIEDEVFPGIEAALDEAEAAGDVARIEESLSPQEELEAEAKARAASAPSKPGASGQRTAAKRPTLKVVGRDGVSITDWLALDARPRTLYVSRNVLNADQIVKWAKAQGFKSTLEPADMHVTIAFSRAPIDWMKVGNDWYSDDDGNLAVKPGGPRAVEALGDKGAVVLMFSDNRLSYRHRDIIDSGASWDWEGFQPHVTITYGLGIDGLNLDTVEPYRGAIMLGPEVFAEVVEDWERGRG